MTIFRYLTFMLLATTLSACASMDVARDMVFLHPTVPVTPVAKTFPKGKQLTNNYSLLFEQKLMAKNTAKLIESFQYSQKKFNMKIDINANHPLYKLSEDDGGIHRYCTFGIVRTVTDMFGKNYSTHTCFFDIEGDGIFDKIYSTGKNIVTDSRFYNTTLVADSAEMTPTRYKALGADSNVSVEAGIRLAGSILERARLEFVIKSEAGVWQVFSSEKIKFNKSDNLPQDIDILGAKLRIHSINKKQVEYEILSGFPNGKTFSLGGVR